jgi:hypothetical protein
LKGSRAFSSRQAEDEAQAARAAYDEALTVEAQARATEGRLDRARDVWMRQASLLARRLWELRTTVQATAAQSEHRAGVLARLKERLG